MLGTLVALYEHAVFTQGVLWDINSFDQWGVELARCSPSGSFPSCRRTPRLTHDSSTNALIGRYRAARDRSGK